MEGQRSTFAISFLVFSILGIYCARGLDLLGRSSESLETDENPSSNENFVPFVDNAESKEENPIEAVHHEHRSLWKRSGREANEWRTRQVVREALRVKQPRRYPNKQQTERRVIPKKPYTVRPNKGRIGSAEKARLIAAAEAARQKKIQDDRIKLEKLRASEKRAKDNAARNQRKLNEFIGKQAGRAVDAAVKKLSTKRGQ